MKILKGLYRGIELAVPQYTEFVRPTVDHMKKNIFQLIGPEVPDVVWDLYAGVGGVGIEFLSRGSRSAVFVEQAKKAMDCLKLNLAECHLENAKAYVEQKIETVLSPVESFLKNTVLQIALEKPNIIFMDPPYGSKEAGKALTLIPRSPFFTPECRVLVEHVIEDIPLPWPGATVLFQEIYGPKALTALKFNG